MVVLQGIEGLKQLPRGGALSIGNYDGVHRGHAAIIQTMRALAAGGSVIVVTFEPHPLTVLKPQIAPPRLTPPELKRRLLESVGATHLVELPPSAQVLGLTAEEFFAILRDEVQPAHIVEGPNFNFGKARAGNVQRMIEWSAGTAIGVHALAAQEVALLDLSLVEVSSTLVRWLLANGRVRDAAICLGRPYALSGEVIRGFARGREIGVPTANLKMTDQLIPDDGVYAGRCQIDGAACIAAVSIGSLPTFEQRAFQIEAHLLDFSGDLYGRTIELELIDWIREQRAFSSLDALKKQIAHDIDVVRDRVSITGSQLPVA